VPNIVAQNDISKYVKEDSLGIFVTGTSLSVVRRPRGTRASNTRVTRGGNTRVTRWTEDGRLRTGIYIQET
jgi:hypothetical protein